MDVLLKMKELVFFVVQVLLLLPEGSTDPVWHEKTLMWTEMAPDKRIQVVGIVGEPEVWIKSHSPQIIGENPTPAETVLYSSRIAIGFHYSKQELYWSDIGFKEIHKTKLDIKERREQRDIRNVNKTVEKIYSGTSQEVNGLAVDWLSGSVYWTDALYNWITVASGSPLGSEKEIYRHLILTGLDKPMGIVLHPFEGKMYWSDWGAVPKIESATLAGEKRTTLIDSSLDRPLGLTIDFHTNELFWVDDFLDTIDVLDLDTGIRRMFKSNVGRHPGPASYFSIAVYEDYLFVTDQLKKIIEVFNRTSQEHVQDVFLGRVPYDIIMYDKGQQKQIDSECDVLKCQHICVSTGLGKGRCICSYGFVLNTDNSTCTANGGIRDPMFVYTIGKSLCATPVNVPDREFVDLKKDITCFLNRTGHAMALAADINGDSIFYSDNVKRTISRVRLTQKTRTDVISIQTGDVRGMAVDWLSSNLYYTDGTFGHIMVSRLQGRYPTILCKGIGTPGGVTLDPAKGMMYWIDMMENEIWEASMDCTNKKSLVQRAVGAEGLAIDIHERRLYWAQQSGIISISLDGTDKKTLTDDYGRTYKDVAIYQEYFAWSDGRNGIFFGEKASGRVIRGFRHLESNVSHDILGFSVYLQPVSEGQCDVQNGGCQQLCIPLPSSYTCRCALGFKLADDKKGCTSDLVRGRFLLMADPYHEQVYQISLEGEDLPPQGLGLSTPEFPTVMDMDTKNEVLYWGDERAGVIKSRRLLDVGSEMTVLDLGENITLRSLVVDGSSGRIFFTLTEPSNGSSVIHVFDLDGGRNRTLETLKGGGTLAFDDRNGQLYWSNIASNGRWVIFRRGIRTQDQDVETLWDNLNEIRDMALSYSENKVYWCGIQTIWRADLHGGDVEVVFTSKKLDITGLAVVGDDIYLSMSNKKSLFRLRMTKKVLKAVTEPVFARISDIKEYWRLPPKALPPPPSDAHVSLPGEGAVVPNRNSSEADPSTSGFLGSHVPMPIVIGVVAGNIALIILIIITVCAFKKCRKKKPNSHVDYGGPSHENPTYVSTELANVDNLYEGLPGATAAPSRDSDLPDIVMDKDGVPLEDISVQSQLAPPLPSPRSPDDQTAGPLPAKSGSVLVSPVATGIGGMNNFFFPTDQEQLMVDLPPEENEHPSRNET